MSSWFCRFLVGCLSLSCSGCAVAASDGFSSDYDSAPLEQDSTAIVPRRLCELLDACGGDLTGRWTTADVCISYMTHGKPPIANCESSTIEGVVDDVQGSYVFNEDGSYSANMEYVGRIVVTAPQRCLRAGVSCAELGEGDSQCVARGDRCECTQPWEHTSAGEVRGTYETIESTVEYSNDDPVKYCVKGDRLTMRTITELPRFGELSIELQIELTRK